MLINFRLLGCQIFIHLSIAIWIDSQNILTFVFYCFLYLYSLPTTFLLLLTFDRICFVFFFTICQRNSKQTKMSMLETCLFSPLIKVPKLPNLLETFVLWTEKVVLYKEQHRLGFFTFQEAGDSEFTDSPTVHFNENRLYVLIHKDASQFTRGLAWQIVCSHDAVDRYVH